MGRLEGGGVCALQTGRWAPSAGMAFAAWRPPVSTGK